MTSSRFRGARTRVDRRASSSGISPFAWIPLGIALAILGLAVLDTDRTTWPFLLGDEATYVMAAESVAYDFDLSYSAEDYRRFSQRWGEKPDLILHSGDSGETLDYGKPFLYPVLLAPFVRLSPENGPAVLNFLLLAVTALMAARALGSSQGNRSPSLVAVLVFGSVTFAHAFWAHPDLLIFCCLAVALSNVSLGDPSVQTASTPLSRVLTAGLLLGLAAAARPIYGVCLLPLLAMKGARRGLPRIVAVAAATFLLAAMFQGLLSGSWSAYGGERRGFTATTGYPDVDFPAQAWEQHIEEFGNVSWLREGALEPRFNAGILTWNTIYFLLGRNVGLVPYFLPLFLLLVHARPSRTLAAGVLAVIIVTIFLFTLRPFNFYGGAGTLANRYFLPLFAIFWFIPLRRVGWSSILVTMAICSVFLWPAWQAPSSFPLLEDHDGRLRYRYSSGITARIFPHETNQKFIRSLMDEDVTHRGTWTRFLDPGVRPGDPKSTTLETLGEGGEILVARRRPFDVFSLSVHRGPGLRVCHRWHCTEVATGTTSELRPGRPTARHRMWWEPEAMSLYRLRITPLPGAGGPSTFSVVPSMN